MSPIDFLWRSAERVPDVPAIFHPEGTLTYRELAQVVLRRAAALRGLMPAAGETVAIGMENSLDHVLTLLATLAAGKTWVPLNPRNGDGELKRIIEFIAPPVILSDDRTAGRLASVAGSTPIVADLAKRTEAMCDGTSSFDARTPSGESLEAIQAIKFTGGSTSLPKGVMQSRRAWNTNIVTQMSEYGLGPLDRYLIAAPLTHGASTYLLPLLGAGGAIIVPHGNKPADLLDSAAAQSATIVFAPPTLVMALVQEQARQPRRLALRYLTYAGAPMAPHNILEAQMVFGPILAASYGQTEAPQIISFMPPQLLHGEHLRSVGRASLLTRIAIRGSDGAAAANGDEGEIIVKGDLTMSGYFRAPDQTAQVFADGWLRTGDLGLLDERGFLFIRGRTRDVIISGGFNVYPIEVEAVTAAQPAVAACAVIGVPDEKWGEAVHAAVVIREGHSEQGLGATLRAELGPVKAPKMIHVFAELPRTPVGKIDKAAVKAEVRERLLADVVQ
jgi:acyl-CoA synthetase (AMP-forming)/AMP-acid ligase II